MGNPLEAAEKLQGCVHVSQIQHFPIELRLLELKEVTRTLQQPSPVRRRVAVSTLLAPVHPGTLSSSEYFSHSHAACPGAHALVSVLQNRSGRNGASGKAAPILAGEAPSWQQAKYLRSTAVG